MKFCPNCGKEIVENASYCVDCGLDITNFNINEPKKSPQNNSTSKRKMSKTVKVIFSVLIFIFATYLVGSSISNFQNIHEKNDSERQILSQEMDDVSMKMLELCTTTDYLEELRGCKSQSIPQLIQSCNDEQLFDLPICSDVRLKEFSNTIDERLVKAEEKVEALKNQISILESIPTETTTSEQSSSYDELHYVDAEIIRDCSRETEIFAEDYMSKIVNLDSISEKQEESIQSNVERISICSADIREIEARGYGSGSVTGYWELMPRLQSLFDEVCGNTGKLCGYTFHGP